MAMRVTEADLPGILVLEPQVFEDRRGFFVETWNAARYAASGLPPCFVQDNLSRSRQGTLRGLHFQEPNPQGKLVMVLAGAVFDVSVDVRRGSPTFGRWFGIELSAENRRQVWIPRGFAHGYLVLSESADFFYKVDAPYSPADERCIAHDDPRLGIPWPLRARVLSEKDHAAPLLEQAGYLPSFV